MRSGELNATVSVNKEDAKKSCKENSSWNDSRKVQGCDFLIVFCSLASR
jgi:hypothetical protein